MPVNKRLLHVEVPEASLQQTDSERSTFLGTIVQSAPIQTKHLLSKPGRSWKRQRRFARKHQYARLVESFLEESAPEPGMDGGNDQERGAKDGGYFPKNTVCPYMGLQKAPYLEVNEPKAATNKYCTGRSPSEEECERAARFYGVSEMPLSCRESPEKELCRIVEIWRPAVDSRLRAKCQLWYCGDNPVYVSSMNPVTGRLEDQENWKAFNTTRELQNGLPDIVRNNAKHGFQFCFLHCLKRDGKKVIKNILTFPPLFAKPLKRPDPLLFNVNVVVLDSVSRRHFYRSMSYSVEALRELFYDESTKAAILDFELLQSLAPHTFPNIRAFMSGYNYHSKGQEYGIGTLFGQMKKRGFYTVLQTDECWSDIWGSIFSNNILRNHRNQEDLDRLWERIRKRAKSDFVDDYGMSFASCEVFKQYNVSSQYDSNTRKVCFNGHPYSQYFFEYVSAVLKGSKAVRGKMPAFSYTHLNAAHEPTGTRLKQIDKALADFLRKMASEDDTLTVVLSDHGPKTTPYSFSSVEGRYEVFDSLLFAVVPEKVALKLGPRRMKALKVNQHRLLSPIELHNAFASIGRAHSSGVLQSFQEIGIFAEIPENRSCGDIQSNRGALCKCQGWETWFPDNDPQFVWLAEFALGQLNNLIQQEYTRTRELGSGGFGNCQRLVGHEFVKIHRTREDDHYLLSMDLIVNPFKQVFEIQMRYPVDGHTVEDERKYGKSGPTVELTHRRRVSTFRTFSTCADDGVEVRLCVCDYTAQNEDRQSGEERQWYLMNSQRDVMEVIRRGGHGFGGITEMKSLHEGCLLLLVRTHGPRRTARAYEVANICNDRSYVVHVLKREDSMPVQTFQESSGFSFSISVLQRTVHFLLSSHMTDELSNDFSPLIKFNLFKLRN